MPVPTATAAEAESDLPQSTQHRLPASPRCCGCCRSCARSSGAAAAAACPASTAGSWASAGGAAAAAVQHSRVPAAMSRCRSGQMARGSRATAPAAVATPAVCAGTASQRQRRGTLRTQLTSTAWQVTCLRSGGVCSKTFQVQTQRPACARGAWRCWPADMCSEGVPWFQTLRVVGS